MNSNPAAFFKKMLTETVVFADRQMNEQKSNILGCFFSVYVNEKIDYDKFHKLMMTLDMFLMADTAVLKDLNTSQISSDDPETASAMHRFLLLRKTPG